LLFFNLEILDPPLNTDIIVLFPATGLEDMAKLRSELESLQEKIVNNQEKEVQQLASLINSCVEMCHLSFAKVGKQIQDYELLKEENGRLSKECQRLNMH
jgi:hypothetical protein